MTELRNAFHISIAASSMRAPFSRPCLEKQIDVSLFSAFTTDPDRTLPIQVTDDDPVYAFGMEISSIPMALGAGRPARSTCFRCMYSLSRSFTVLWCRRSISAVQTPCSAYPGTVAHMHGKALRIASGCLPAQPESDVLHENAAAPRTSDTPAFELQVDSPSRQPTGRSYPQHLLVVTPAAALTTNDHRSVFFAA